MLHRRAGCRSTGRDRTAPRRFAAHRRALARPIVLGARVWSRQHKFRVVFGPLGLADYLRLLPGGTSLHRLIPVVRNYAGDALIWDVNLILKAEEVPPLRLGRQGRLGWTTWLVPRRSAADAADLFLDASADSMARTVDARSRARPGPAHQAEATHMSEISRAALFGKLNPLAYQGASKARPCSASCAATRMSSWCTGSTRSCRPQDSDLHRIVRHFSARCRRGWPPT